MILEIGRSWTSGTGTFVHAVKQCKKPQWQLVDNAALGACSELSRPSTSALLCSTILMRSKPARMSTVVFTNHEFIMLKLACLAR